MSLAEKIKNLFQSKPAGPDAGLTGTQESVHDVSVVSVVADTRDMATVAGPEPEPASTLDLPEAASRCWCSVARCISR